MIPPFQQLEPDSPTGDLIVGGAFLRVLRKSGSQWSLLSKDFRTKHGNLLK